MPWQVKVRVSSKTAFPLHLRIPGWTSSATVSLNGGAAEAATPGTFHAVTVGPETIVALTFTNDIRVEKGYNDSSVSVHRGALLYAMDIGNGEPPVLILAVPISLGVPNVLSLPDRRGEDGQLDGWWVA